MKQVNQMTTLRQILISATCMSLFVSPCRAETGEYAGKIPVQTAVESIGLDSSGSLHGMVVDPNGQPLAGIPIVVGRQGKLVAEFETDTDGKFIVPGISPGLYQIVSHAKAQNYQIQTAASYTQHTKRGVVHVMPRDVVRGNECQDCDNGRLSRRPLYECLTNPALLVVGIIVGGVVAIALSDDAS